MLESIKKDRVIQLLIVAAMLVALVACVAFAAAGWRYYERSQVIAPPLGPSPSAKPAPGTPIVLEFKGVGDKVIFFDVPASGAGLIGFGYIGEHNFIVNLFTTDGRLIDQPVNHIGEYKGERALSLEKGSYMLEIKADGDWFVVILPPQ
jgi:hypothetical protein